jgi:squalene cyclase
MINRGVQFVRDQQRDDGSWYGSWAVCFTSGCWFGAEALATGGDPAGRDAGALARCCAFLLSQQLPDGGWGETYLSCLTKSYSSPEPPVSQVVCTAWAVLALISAQCSDGDAVRRGIDFLVLKQRADGNWDQERISGTLAVESTSECSRVCAVCVCVPSCGCSPVNITFDCLRCVCVSLRYI